MLIDKPKELSPLHQPTGLVFSLSMQSESSLPRLPLEISAMAAVNLVSMDWKSTGEADRLSKVVSGCSISLTHANAESPLPDAATILDLVDCCHLLN